MKTCNSCGETPPTDEYLLVKATAKNAAVCGPDESSPSSDCPIKEPTFDASQSDFLVPGPTAVANMQVCNAEVYMVNQWLYFLQSKVYLKISGISGNILSLVNQVSPGVVVDSNVDPGYLVSKGSLFSVAGGIDQKEDSFYSDKINEILAGVSEIPANNLAVSSTTAVVHPVGRVESDPSNASVKKAIRRIYGFLFKAGTPVLSALKVANTADRSLYQRIVKHKTNNEVRVLPNYSEYNTVTTGNQYALSVTKDGEKLINTYFPKFYYQNLEKSSNEAANATWPGLPSGGFSKDFNVESADITGSLGNPTEVWLMLRVEAGITRGSSDPVTAEIKINNRHVAYLYSDDDGNKVSFCSTMVNIRVPRSDLKITINITADKPCKYFYRLAIEGMFI